MTETTWTPTTITLSKLKPWERNPKRISKAHAARLLDLWERLGQFQTIAIGPGGEVYDGHQRLSVLKAKHGGSYVVQVLQASRPLTEAEREELTIAAHSGTTGSWDWDALAGWDVGNLTAWGLDEELLKDWNAGATALREMLTAETAATGEDPGPQPDRAEELREKWQVEPGQLWALGDHRLLVGSCTDPAVFGRLMNGQKAQLCWTDPPWNVAYGATDHPSWRQRTIINDNLGADFPEFIRQFCQTIKDNTHPGALLYMAMSAQEWPNIDAGLRAVGFHWSSTIIWVKDHAVLSRKDYHTRYEPIWYGWNEDGARLVPLEDRSQNDVWEIPRPTRSEEHPTMKPVELVQRAVQNSSLRGDLVIDPFLGSGTTLIACERLGRRCRAVEISPGYCAVAIQRWVDMTGGEPVLLSLNS